MTTPKVPQCHFVMGNSKSALNPRDQVVLITGCSEGGIGYYLALEFKKRGATVFASSRNAATMGGLEERGVHVLPLDITSQSSITSAVAGILGSQGRIDILVNNAGMSMASPFAETPLDVWRKFYETNVFGLVSLSQAVFPAMAKRKRGRILNISSVAAFAHRPWSSVYSSTKAAVSTMTDCMRMEMKPFGVDVILVCPGYIKTNIFSKAVTNSVDLPPGSLYAAYEPVYKGNYAEKATDRNDTPADKFAVWVVDGALKAQPPWRMVLGRTSWAALLVTYLPVWMSDWFFWRFFVEQQMKKVKTG